MSSAAPVNTVPAKAAPVVHIQSAANALLKDLRRLAHDNAAYRKQGRVWLEGDHLARAALARGQTPALAVFSASFWQSGQAQWVQAQAQAQAQTLAAMKNIVVDDALFATLSTLESPARMGVVLTLPPAPALRPDAPSLVLDRVQDAGNVGAMLRSAAAFGFTQVLAMQGTAALWGPKVLRAGMGAHFGLRLIEGLRPEDVDALQVPLLATSSHQGEWLHRASLPWPCAWVMGHEGQGVGAALMQRAAQQLRIAQPGGEESLNVGAAAAICLHASAVARLAP